ncbi:unnamed protein product [Diabrotica balteata]|uniref:Equilibrative nucleoside transporter 3 n=1 Tax=Diabrotica balteata TaxID=107213 RepID=A0A9N9XL33_DIABA|nr:unnamed protein product [Diabrotica balteata]
MAYSVNTTPLLQEQYDSDAEDDGNDILIPQDKPLFKAEPIDKFYATYIIFYILGIVSLLPWNFFITADDYWMYKFRNVSNITNIRDAPPKRSPLQAEFTSYLTLTSCYPNLVFLILNTAISQRVSLNKRVLGSLSCMLALMLLTLVFVNINTDSWQQWFFVITLMTSFLLNVFSPIFCGSLVGIVGKFSPIYITAVIGGQALGGVFAAITQIASLAIGASSAHTALVYFVIGNFTIALGIVLYIVLSRSVFFTYHTSDQSVIINEFQRESIQEVISYKEILRKTWGYCFCAFFTYVVTIAAYPGVTVLVESEGKGHGNRWNDVYFVPTIAYLLFSIGDYSGRIVAGRLLKPRNITVIIILTISRIIFIPLILLCNAQPRHILAVVFNKDYQYILILFIFAFTNGFMTNIIQILIPKVVDQHEKEIASSIVIVFIGIGAAIGSTISIFLIRLI